MANKPNFSSRSGKSQQSKQQSAERKAKQAGRKQQGLNGSKNHKDSLKGGGGNNTGKKSQGRNFLGF